VHLGASIAGERLVSLVEVFQARLQRLSQRAAIDYAIPHFGRTVDEITGVGTKTNRV
jgi:hypothetical protein